MAGLIARSDVLARGQKAKHALFVSCVQGREGKVTQVYRRKWVIHIERITREKVNGENMG